eukprot:1819547-Amphidinium_carterae.1
MRELLGGRPPGLLSFRFLGPVLQQAFQCQQRQRCNHGRIWFILCKPLGEQVQMYGIRVQPVCVMASCMVPQVTLYFTAKFYSELKPRRVAMDSLTRSALLTTCGS